MAFKLHNRNRIQNMIKYNNYFNNLVVLFASGSTAHQTLTQIFEREASTFDYFVRLSISYLFDIYKYPFLSMPGILFSSLSALRSQFTCSCVQLYCSTLYTVIDSLLPYFSSIGLWRCWLLTLIKTKSYPLNSWNLFKLMYIMPIMYAWKNTPGAGHEWRIVTVTDVP